MKTTSAGGFSGGSSEEEEDSEHDDNVSPSESESCKKVSIGMLSMVVDVIWNIDSRASQGTSKSSGSVEKGKVKIGSGAGCCPPLCNGRRGLQP